jgi:hypothetical protein
LRAAVKSYEQATVEVGDIGMHLSYIVPESTLGNALEVIP